MCGSHISGATQSRGVMDAALLAKVEAEISPAARDLSLTVAGEPFMTPKLATFVAIRNRAQIARWERAGGGTVPCRFLRSGTFVTLGGDVNPCTMPGRPVAGNLLESSFAEIWNGEVLTAMRRGFLEGTPMACCAHCSQNPIGYDPSDEATARPPDPSLPGWFDGGISAGRATTNGGVGS